ncbi:hypothetical protein A4A49_37894 [Nicotiana attenuata]|uniref:Uncharacterized protein n=1 Tax=Nicotiana attenuata TaxID=49451 RepID=A0A1J6IMG9_NICAT|nr:hypothetical protein A4A49_37894 [Nicotiana attenuata]
MDVMVLYKFNGGNPEGWVYRAERYFTYLGFSEKDWIPLPYYYLDGEALTWFDWLFQNEQFYDSNHFKEKLKLHFRTRTFTNLVSTAETSQACVDYVSYATLVPPTTSESPIAALNHLANSYELESDFKRGNSEAANVFDKMSKRADERDSVESVSSVPALEIQVRSDSIEVDAIDYIDSIAKTLANNEGKMPDQISQGTSTILWNQFADNILFPIPFDDSSLLPSSVEGAEQLNAHVLFPKIESALEDNTTSHVNLVFAKSPKRDTTEQLSPFAPMLLESLTSLVTGGNFPICQILALTVSVNLDNGYMLDSSYCFHARAGTYVYHVPESIIGTILFGSCVDNWFDTGQDFQVDSCVFLSLESEVLTPNEDSSKTKVVTSNLDNWEDRQAEGSFLLLGYHCDSTLKVDFINILWFYQDFNAHLDYWGETRQERNLFGFLFELRVHARKEKLQGVLQAIVGSYSKQSPNIWVNKAARLLFAMFGLARSTLPYIIFDPGGVNTSLCALIQQLLFQLVKYFTTENYDTTQQHMKMRPAANILTVMLQEWKALNLRSGYKVKHQEVEGAGYTFSGSSENCVVAGHVIIELNLVMLKHCTVNTNDQGCDWLIASVMGLSGEQASKIVYQYFMDNSPIDGSELVKECCLYYISSDFKIIFAPSIVPDGCLGCHLSDAISYIVAYHVNTAFDREGNDSTISMKNFIWDPFPVVQAHTIDLSLQSRISAKEEWTEWGTADTITILLSYLRMFAYACITLTDTLCFSSSCNPLLLNIWADWEVIVCSKEELRVPQKFNFSLIEFRVLWSFATGIVALVLSFSLLLIDSKRWQARAYEYVAQVKLRSLLLSTKSHNDQSFGWFITGALAHIFLSSHKACLGFEIRDWELASISVLDSNLEDKVLINDGSIVMNQARPNVTKVAIGLRRAFGPRTNVYVLKSVSGERKVMGRWVAAGLCSVSVLQRKWGLEGGSQVW